MFFAQEYVNISLVNILRVERDLNCRLSHQGRPYSSLSLRYDSEAVIECYGEAHDVSNALCYFPASMQYSRIAKRDNMLVVHFINHSHVSTQLEYFVPRDPQAYRELFEQALSCWSAREPGYRFRAAACVHQILALAYEENQAKAPMRPLIEESMRLIEKNAFCKGFRIDSLAQELHVSPAYLRMLFSETLGISPKRYVLQQRIQKAISLLETNYFAVADVADQVGFSDPKHFSVQFKKITGVSPSEYVDRFGRR